MTKLLLLALPVSVLLYGALWAFRCHHHSEVAHRLPDGTMGLRCPRCGHSRRHPFSAPELVRPRLTQPGGPVAIAPTGIERELAEARAEAAAIGACIAGIETAERRAKVVTLRRFEGRV